MIHVEAEETAVEVIAIVRCSLRSFERRPMNATVRMSDGQVSTEFLVGFVLDRA